MTLGANYSRVQFNFQGSLRLARELWALGDKLDQTRSERAADAENAQANWLGPRRDEFSSQASTEGDDLTRLGERLRTEARLWAAAWRDAMNEQNRRNRAARVEIEHNKRSVGETIVDYFIGTDDDNEVTGVIEVAVPQPPMFAPTGREQFL